MYLGLSNHVAVFLMQRSGAKISSDKSFYNHSGAGLLALLCLV